MPRHSMIATPVVVGACFTLLAASPARAQPTVWSDRALFSVNFGVQPNARPFGEQLSQDIYRERASIDAAHPGDGGKLTIDVAGGVHLWKNFGVGGAFTKSTTTETVTVNAEIPHPIFFGQPRLASTTAPFQRSEYAIHIQALYVIPVTSRIDVVLSGGPSLIAAQQDLVQSIEVTEAGPPYTSAAIGKVAPLTIDVSTVGMNVGADVTWFVTPLAGIGFTARYVRGTAQTELRDHTPIDLDVGGFQVGFGARIRLR